MKNYRWTIFGAYHLPYHVEPLHLDDG